MKIPTKLSISGYELKIKHVDKLKYNDEDCYGLYNSSEKTIYLIKGMTPTRKKEIFVHEYLHFLEDIYRIKISEDGVSALALGILQLINNPKVKI